MTKYKGSGWHRQSVRYSNARKYGKAGGTYKSELIKKLVHKHPEYKNLTFKQLKKRGVFLSYQGDADKDGVINIKDCKPLNPKKHRGFIPLLQSQIFPSWRHDEAEDEGYFYQRGLSGRDNEAIYIKDGKYYTKDVGKNIFHRISKKQLVIGYKRLLGSPKKYQRKYPFTPPLKKKLR
jgi:hypothetical protein